MMMKLVLISSVNDQSWVMAAGDPVMGLVCMFDDESLFTTLV